MIPKLYVPIESVVRFQRVVLPLLHSIITNEGVEIPSPVSLYLGQFLGSELFSRVSMIDLEIRQLRGSGKLEYADLMDLYYGMLSMLHYGITCYDDFERLYTNPPAKPDLPKTYFEIIQDRLFVRHRFIKELVAAKSGAQVSKITTKQINEEIRSVFVDAEQDYQLVQAVLEKGHPYYREMVDPEAIYSICQAVIEIKLLKNTVLHEGKKNETDGAFIDYLSGLAKSQVEKTNDLDQRLCLMELEAKVSYHIKHDFRPAISLIIEAQKLLDESEYEKSSEEYQVIKVGMVAEQLIFTQPQLLMEKKVSNLAPLREALELALTAKPMLSYAGDVTKQQLYLSTSKFLSAYVAGLKRDLNEATLESCDALQHTVLDTLKYLSFLKLLDDPAGHAKFLLMCQKIQEDLSGLLRGVKEKRAHLEKAQIDEAKKLAELEEKQRVYDEQFEALFKSFEDECKAKIVERTNKLPAHPVRRLPKPVKPTESTHEVLEAPEEYSVSKASIAFFNANNLEDAQAFVDEQNEEDKAEAMLYVGDKYLMVPKIKEALSWYERAIDAYQGQIEPDPRIKEGIEMMLAITYQVLASQLALSIRHQEAIENNLYNKIIEWGLKECKKANVDPRLLGMRDQESIDLVYEAGWQEFLRRGEQNKQANGGSPSPAAMEKQALKFNQKIIRRNLEKTQKLISAVKLRVVTEAKDFPALKNNPATLYQPKPKSKPAQKKPANRKSKH